MCPPSTAPPAAHLFPCSRCSSPPAAAGDGGGSDLQLAWENLETAKVIWQREGEDKNAQQLAGGCRSSVRRLQGWVGAC